MTKWEYKIIEGSITVQYEGYSLHTLEDKLNVLGMEGWEICGMTLDQSNLHSNEIYLKREVKDVLEMLKEEKV